VSGGSTAAIDGRQASAAKATPSTTIAPISTIRMRLNHMIDYGTAGASEGSCALAQTAAGAVGWVEPFARPNI
jgi:hypothetical protein